MDVLTARGVSNPEQLMIAQQEYEFINAKIENVLSDFERAVLKEYIAGKSYSEIASDMNTQPKSVDNALPVSYTHLDVYKRQVISDVS